MSSADTSSEWPRCFHHTAAPNATRALYAQSHPRGLLIRTKRLTFTVSWAHKTRGSDLFPPPFIVRRLLPSHTQITMEASSCLITPPLKPSCCMRGRGVDPLSSFSSNRRRRSAVSKLPSRSLAITCCGSVSSDSNLPVASDWRAFRAKLVTAENTNSVVEIGDKWAHPLHLPEKGCLLVATRKLDGVHIFERAIVLILTASPTRLVGVILNKPSLMSIASTSAAAFEGCRLFFGGPLKEEGLFLLNGKGGGGVFEEVMKGLYYGTRESVGCASEMVKRGAANVEEMVFFDGCCGWEKVQLEEEVSAGYWSVVACSASVVAAVAATAGKEGSGRVVWEEVVGLAGGRNIW